MSGHKRATVTISQEEYRRLYDAEKRAYYETLSIPDHILASTVQASQKHLVSNFDALADRQAVYEQVLNQYHDQLKNIEATTTQSLYDEQLNFYNQLLDMSDQVWQDTSDLLQVQSQEFETNVISQNQHLLDQIQTLDQRISRFNNREERLIHSAAIWQNDVELINNFLNHHYPSFLLEEYGVNSFQNQIKLIQNNFDDGYYEASLSLSQQVFNQLSQVRLNMENQLSQRSALIQAVTDNLSLLIQCGNSNKNIHAIDLDGAELQDTIDVDYWTNNKLQEFIAKTTKTIIHFQETGLRMQPHEIQFFLDEDMTAFTDELTGIINDARMKALNSQLRFNMAQMVLLAVMNQGYSPQMGSYTDEDYRLGYLAKAISADGSEIVVKVDPLEGMQNELQLINSQPGIINEIEQRKRSIEIMQSLNVYGLEVGTIEKVDRPSSQTSQRKLKGALPSKSKPLIRRQANG